MALTKVGMVNGSVQTQTFNFAEWDFLAKKFNPIPKVFLGFPGAPELVGYVGLDTLRITAQNLQGMFSTFGGITLWYLMLTKS
jgi:hypothetical protein